MSTNLTYDEWVEQYSPYLGPTESGNEAGLFETYGKDLEFISKNHDSLIWTLVDTGGSLIILNGYHFIDRVNYMFSAKPWSTDVVVEYLDEDEQL
jgi:hypothetical protein